MSKTFYIFIYLLLEIKFCKLKYLYSYFNDDYLLLISFFWMILSFYLFPIPKNKILFSLHTKKFVYILFFSFILSAINASYSWNQSFFSTIITQRFVYNFFFIYVLLYIQPSENEINKALKWISLYIITVWCLSIFDPRVIVMTEHGLKVLEYYEKNNLFGTDLGQTILGFQLVYLYYALRIYYMLKEFNKRNILIVLFLLLFLLLFQNRSVLIVSILVFLYGIISSRLKNKILIIFTLFIILFAVSLYTIEIITSLIEETTRDLSNDSYARWLSFSYYLHDYHHNFISYITGSGCPSKGSSLLHLTSKLQLKHIHYSDVGIIGSWAIYGIIPIILFTRIIIKSFIKKEIPIYVKILAIFFVFPLNFNITVEPNISMLSFLFYLYSLNVYKSNFYSEKISN